MEGKIPYNKKLFGENLKKERLKRGLTIQKFAETMNIRRDSISLAEKGKRGLSLESLCKLKDTFGISIDSLLLDNSSEVHITDEE